MSLADYNTEPGRVAVRKQPPNMYTVLLLVSVVALAIGCLFMFLELQSYGLSVTVPSDAKVPSAPPSATAPSAAAPSAAAPGTMIRPAEGSDRFVRMQKTAFEGWTPCASFCA